MKDAKGIEWRHMTARNIYELKGPESVEVFDDEEPGLVHLYITDGKVRHPARSVDTSNRKHFESVLSAWAASRPLIDRRNDRTIPLPNADASLSASPTADEIIAADDARRKS